MSALDPRDAHRKGQIFLHYKGGIYRRITALACAPPSLLGKTQGVTAFRVLHADDRRELIVVAHPSLGFLVVNDREEMAYPVMLYISQQKLVLWVRRHEEFHSSVMLPDGSLKPRFSLYDFSLEDSAGG